MSDTVRKYLGYMASLPDFFRVIVQFIRVPLSTGAVSISRTFVMTLARFSTTGGGLAVEVGRSLSGRWLPLRLSRMRATDPLP